MEPHRSRPLSLSGTSHLPPLFLYFNLLLFIVPFHSNSFLFVTASPSAGLGADLIVCGDVCHPGDSPADIAIDPTNGDLYISDTYNHRVLRFGPVATLTTDNPPIVAVFGQVDQYGSSTNQGNAFPSASSLNSPTGIFVDKAGTLWIADSDNNRVLRFANVKSLATGDPATGVLGQAAFATSSNTPTSSSKMDNPTGVHVDDVGRLWVVDQGNNRVLRFDNSTLLVNGQSADGVIGQVNFVLATSGTAADKLKLPTSVTSCLGTLVVSDSQNNRIDEAAKPNSARASYAFMQTDLNSGSSSATSASTGKLPGGLSCDPASGDLYTADHDFNRVLVYQNGMTPSSSGQLATVVIGQKDFFSILPGSGLDQLNKPASVFLHQATRTVWVADKSNNRVLRFSNVILQSQTNSTELFLSFISNSPSVRLLPLDSAGVSYPGQFELQLHPTQFVETSQTNETVASDRLPDTGYNVSTSTDAQGTEYFKFSTTLDHAQGVEFDFALFRKNQTLNSAGVDFSIRPSTVKLSLALDRWNFTSSDNRLSLELALLSSPPITSITQVQSITSEISTFLLKASTNLTIAVELLNVAEIDNVNTPITYSFNGLSQLILTFPSFRESLGYDPNFSVVFGDYSGIGDGDGSDGEADGDSSESLRWLALIALVVVPGALVLVVVSAIVVFWVMHRRRVNGLHKVNFGIDDDDEQRSSNL